MARRAGTTAAFAARALGLTLAALGGLAACVFGGIGLPLSLRAEQVVAGVAATLAALGIAGAGYLLLRAGSRPLGLRPGEWFRESARRHVLMLMYAGCGLLAMVFGVGGGLLLSQPDRPSSEGGLFVAFVPIFLGTIALFEVARRGGGKARQWVAVSSGFVIAGVLLVIFGLTVADAGKLVVYGVVCLGAVGGTTATAAARRNFESESTEPANHARSSNRDDSSDGDRGRTARLGGDGDGDGRHGRRA